MDWAGRLWLETIARVTSKDAFSLQTPENAKGSYLKLEQ